LRVALCNFPLEGLDFLLEPSSTPRPKTSTSVARRLISNALQRTDVLQASQRQKEQEETLEKQRQEKRRQKMEKKDYWNE
jgi:hypothetical protein